jgi:hypothetical protein
MIEEGTNNTVYPTHSCFDDAMEFIDYLAVEFKDESMPIQLVHGLMKGDDGQLHAHAWVEESNMGLAVFAGIHRGQKTYFYTPVKDFYACYRITETTKYSIEEALQNNLRTIHFGPWEPKYVALQGDGGNHTIIGTGTMKLGRIGRLPTTRKEKTNVTLRSDRSNSRQSNA